MEQAGTWGLSQTFMRKKEIFKSERILRRADLQDYLFSGDCVRCEDFCCLLLSQEQHKCIIFLALGSGSRFIIALFKIYLLLSLMNAPRPFSAGLD